MFNKQSLPCPSRRTGLEITNTCHFIITVANISYLRFGFPETKTAATLFLESKRTELGRASPPPIGQLGANKGQFGGLMNQCIIETAAKRSATWKGSGAIHTGE